MINEKDPDIIGSLELQSLNSTCLKNLSDNASVKGKAWVDRLWALP
jgi:hypothetical protein